MARGFGGDCHQAGSIERRQSLTYVLRTSSVSVPMINSTATMRRPPASITIVRESG